MLYGFVVFIHIIACLVLIMVILLQAGRGGGLAESFGGSSTQTIFGTRASVFLMRATSVCAVVFIITCLVLGVLTTSKSKSLIDRQTITFPQIPTTSAGVPLTEAPASLPVPQAEQAETADNPSPESAGQQ